LDFFFSSRRRHTRSKRDWSSDVCSSDLGQGTGQALNFGAIYEQAGLEGGANFGLTIAALGFLVACIGGVIYINVMHKKGKIVIRSEERRVGKEGRSRRTPAHSKNTTIED